MNICTASSSLNFFFEYQFDVNNICRLDVKKFFCVSPNQPLVRLCYWCYGIFNNLWPKITLRKWKKCFHRFLGKWQIFTAYAFTQRFRRPFAIWKLLTYKKSSKQPLSIHIYIYMHSTHLTRHFVSGITLYTRHKLLSRSFNFQNNTKHRMSTINTTYSFNFVTWVITLFIHQMNSYTAWY